jgi:transcriptional regulator with XRE-family HTH domain
MKIDKDLSDSAVIEEIGRRITRRRIDMNLTQATLAERAGIGKRTVERVENGESAQLSSVVRMLRVLDLLPALDAMLPEAGIKPLDVVKLKGRQRKRASPGRSGTSATWEWQDKS